ncbi:MAG TPA: FHA domain-containing protein [Acidimicrobiales bacterium]|jgi:pSer/pThr/pTyr-binding forkhead associated (FHA) protein|nr:FHA domain-containing protein [Acidimicrobiales bacterium]
MHLYLVLIPGPTNNAPVLRALEYVVILLLWLFFMWVVRAVWVEVRPLKRKRRREKDDDIDPAIAGKSRKGKQLRLHVVRPEDLTGTTYEIGAEVTVGRAAGCGVPIDYDTFASNLHARLFRLDGDVWVEDLGSTNGTWVNTERILERTRIEKGDLLQVGGTVFEVGK